MIGGLRTTIEAKEAKARLTIRQALHVAGDETKMAHVPFRRHLEIRPLHDHVPDLEQGAWLQGRAHRTIDARLALRCIDGPFHVFISKRLLPLDAMDQPHFETPGIF
jgi:hypothetical protein